ncbi:MAG TPA: fibronectin type III domain-containing protein [Tepidisphaeraceae bacterium]|nr:fibronectin type III domain-containing protein [Tepidisphaeraceae bacterium]
MTAAGGGKVFFSADDGAHGRELWVVNPPAAPAAPTDGRAALVGQSSLTLDWTDNASGETAYQIARVNADGTRTVIGTTAADATSYAVTGLAAATAYTFEVRAVTAAQKSAPLAVTVTTEAAPGMPTGLAGGSVTPVSATLSWQDEASNELGYEVHVRQGAAEEWQTLAVLPPGAGTGPMSYVATGLFPAQAHEFRVAALLHDAAVPSGPTTVTTPLPGAPAAPINVTAVEQPRGDVLITWTDASPGAGGFKIARRQAGGEWYTIGTTAAGVTAFTDTTGAPGATCEYAVYATTAPANGGGGGEEGGGGGAGGAGGTWSGPSATASAQHGPPGGYINVYANGNPPAYMNAQWSHPGGEFPLNGSVTLTLGNLPQHTYLDVQTYVETSMPEEDDDGQATIQFSVGGKTFGGDFGASERVYDGDGTWTLNRAFYIDPAARAMKHSGAQMTMTATASGFPPSAVLAKGQTHVSTFLPTVSLSVTDGEAAEPGGPGNDGQFKVTRDGPTTERLAVEVRYSGSANGNDYYLPANTITIPAGQSERWVDLRVRDDNIHDPDESVELSLAPSNRYVIDPYMVDDGIGIVDNDTGPGGGKAPTGVPGGPGTGTGDPPPPPPPVIAPPPDIEEPVEPDEEPDEPGGEDEPAPVKNVLDLGARSLSPENTYGSTTDGDGDPPPEDTWWVRLNDDFDRMKEGDPVARDNQDALLEDDELGDGELFYLPLTHTSSGGTSTEFSTFTLTFPSNFKVYRPADNPEVDPVWTQITSGATFTTDPSGGDPYVPSGFIFDPVEATPNPVPVEMTMSRGGSTVSDIVRFVVFDFDVDVDSDNTDGSAAPERSATEDYIEERIFDDAPARRRYDQKIIPTNDDDTDGDGVAGMDDGWNKDRASAQPPQLLDDVSVNDKFTPVVFSGSSAIDPNAAKIFISYDDHDPLDPPDMPFTGGGFPNGLIRLWTAAAHDRRSPRPAGLAGPDAGDYVTSGEAYEWSALNGSGTITLYAEGIVTSREKGDVMVFAHVDPDGDGPQGYVMMDSVQITVVDVDVMIGADDAGDASLADDWVGAPTAGSARQHTILNFTRVTGPRDLEMELSVGPQANGPFNGGGSVELVGFNPDGTQQTGLPIKDTLYTDNHLDPIFGRWSDWGEFFIEGVAVSNAPEDVRIDASFGGQVLGSETLTVLKFGTETQTFGSSPVPLNPVHVNSVAHDFDGNLFAADAGPATYAGDTTGHNTDYPGKNVKPALVINEVPQSRKIAPGQIEVVWGREIAGTLVKSTDVKSPLKINPANNGTLPAQADNLRMRDVAFPAMYDNASNTNVLYHMGHPTERAQPSLSIFVNAAATIRATPVLPRQFNIIAHIIDYVDPATGVRTATAVTVGDVNAMVAQLNTIWSQVGISFSLRQTVTNATSNQNERDIEIGYNMWQTTTNDDVTALQNSLNAIDVYFVNSIFAKTNALGSGVFDNGNTVLPNQRATPGLIIAKTLGAGATNVRDTAGMGRTLAHEMGHYFLNSASHEDDVWNLMVGGGPGSQRDIERSQADRIRASIVSPTNHDGQAP